MIKDPTPGEELFVVYDGYEEVKCRVVKCDGVWTDIVWLSDSKDGALYEGMEIRALTDKLYREGDERPHSAMADLASLFFTGRKA